MMGRILIVDSNKDYEFIKLLANMLQNEYISKKIK